MTEYSQSDGLSGLKTLILMPVKCSTHWYSHLQNSVFRIVLTFLWGCNPLWSQRNTVLNSAAIQMWSWYAVWCFVDRASLYNLVNKANLVHNFC